MLPQRSHITRKRGIYYYRRRLPNGLPGEVALSLRTTHFRRAEHLANLLDRFFVQQPLSIRSMADVKAILKSHLADLLQDTRDWYYSTPPGHPLTGSPGSFPDEHPASIDLEVINDQIAEYENAIRLRHLGLVQSDLDRYVEQFGLNEAERVELGLGLLRTVIQALEATAQLIEKGPYPAISNEAPTASHNAALAQTDAANDSATPRLSELLPSFIELMLVDEGWKGQTLNQNQATYRMFMEVVGDLPVSSYVRRHCGEFFELLRKLPSLYSKGAEWKGMTLREIAQATKGENLDRLAMKTIRRHFSALGRFFSYCIEQGYYEGKNPAHGFRFPQKGRPSQKRAMWSGEKLAALFASPLWTGCRSARERSKPGELIIQDEKFWLPLLGLFHGNRLEEFAQLRCSDVRQGDGVWYLDINDDGDKQVKNEQSKRKVPIHPEILRLGFLGYVKETAPAPSDPVFPKLKPGGADGKRGHAFTKWWTNYRKKIGLYEKGLDYHSFRHGVTTKLYDAGVREVFVDELTGHEGKGTGRTHYLKELSLPNLYAAISKVHWPEVDLEVIASKLQKNLKAA